MLYHVAGDQLSVAISNETRGVEGMDLVNAEVEMGQALNDCEGVEQHNDYTLDDDGQSEDASLISGEDPGTIHNVRFTTIHRDFTF